MPRFDDVLALLEERIAELEARTRALRKDNEHMRTALAQTSSRTLESEGQQPGKHALRLASVEAEREDVRGRLRNLLDAL